jgi:hypothetical protein
MHRYSGVMRDDVSLAGRARRVRRLEYLSDSCEIPRTSMNTFNLGGYRLGQRFLSIRSYCMSESIESRGNCMHIP